MNIYFVSLWRTGNEVGLSLLQQRFLWSLWLLCFSLKILCWLQGDICQSKLLTIYCCFALPSIQCKASFINVDNPHHLNVKNKCFFILYFCKSKYDKILFPVIEPTLQIILGMSLDPKIFLMISFCHKNIWCSRIENPTNSS